ncbi:MAG: tal [Burkholderiales bacterium]|jgi:transaldolase|nr:tal [Burkholderiales bacterium]
MTNRVQAIKQFGQKIWIDNLSRELINSGKLAKLIEEDGIAGVTSNPTIFYKAISTDKSYQDDLIKIKQTNLSPEARYEHLVIPDIQAACDVMLPLYTQSKFEDGYVSFEVSPHLSHDKQGTIDNAKRLWQKINRPNLMIKIPATTEGIEAFEQLIFDGINVNITLLFSLGQVISTWNAYINALKKRFNRNLPVDTIKSVASFFLSRIDSAIDNKLPEDLQGKAAINLAKMAFLAYSELFSSETFSTLKRYGAREQYLLWASTGTKNPKYSDVLYIEELIGNPTINTAPDATLDAFRDHGTARSSLNENINLAPVNLERVQQYVNMDELGEQLQKDGLKLFEDSFDKLMELVK